LACPRYYQEESLRHDFGKLSLDDLPRAGRRQISLAPFFALIGFCAGAAAERKWSAPVACRYGPLFAGARPGIGIRDGRVPPGLTFGHKSPRQGSFSATELRSVPLKSGRGLPTDYLIPCGFHQALGDCWVGGGQGGLDGNGEVDRAVTQVGPLTTSAGCSNPG
jgi:hypothetical protein